MNHTTDILLKQVTATQVVLGNYEWAAPIAVTLGDCSRVTGSYEKVIRV